MSVFKTIRKFLHRDDGFLYTTLGVTIPIKATTNANLTGPVTSVGNATTIAYLGTPASGDLTNCTGLPVGGVVDLEDLIYFRGGH
jgi:hypothetical protein